jgi:hypothetical protein
VTGMWVAFFPGARRPHDYISEQIVCPGISCSRCCCRGCTTCPNKGGSNKGGARRHGLQNCLVGNCVQQILLSIGRRPERRDQDAWLTALSGHDVRFGREVLVKTIMQRGRSPLKKIALRHETEKPWPRGLVGSYQGYVWVAEHEIMYL